MKFSAGNIWISLRYCSTIPVRFFIALCSLISGSLFIFAPDSIGELARYKFLFALFSPTVWGSIFLLDGLLLLWRIFDDHSRVALSRLINVATFFLWLMFTVASAWALDYCCPDLAASIVIILATIWTTLRTDFNPSDVRAA